ncbi:hypothetical protein [Streptomyces anandii]
MTRARTGPRSGAPVSAGPARVVDGRTVASTLVSVAALLVPLAVAALLR